ncbi:phosphonate ABC transporter ATP-binding protein [Lujinxingia litoralis]|uniref:Phosphonate ABC transporter ATP-binding protein n=1 Tax=Lujinxingia litoralis TaxID=2211119 RepID=A0A328C804_9DELT|nr:phosphonate ABC transporter ATP-binding protein [Lujinxingia litoralis]RAL21788.1 phosphonate ABC transporter ATP-binding protein [Lujinxingia litoralis]
MLTLQGLHKRYPDGFVALPSVDLQVPRGQLVALIGPSGAGKSTLIRCINRLVEPTAGSVKLGDQELSNLSRAELREARRRIAMIFQDYALVDRLTVMENVLSGRLGYVSFLDSLLRRFPPADVERAFDLLETVGLKGLHDRRADALSGGQRQRVGIARALMQQPELLLVDEPTASLDPRTARQVMQLLSDLCKERDLTAIINIHDVPLARAYTDRIVGLQAGSIVFDGAPAELTDAVLPEIYGGEDWDSDQTHLDTAGEGVAA